MMIFGFGYPMRSATVYTLNITALNADRTLSLLTNLKDSAERKEIFIEDLRKKLINYALIIFAGTFTFGITHAKEGYAFFSALALFIAVICLAILDRRYHKYSHGWRETQKQFVSLICDVLNGFGNSIQFRRYVVEG
jgi:hypothetical protein